MTPRDNITNLFPLNELERNSEPEPVSLSDVLIGIGEAVGEWVADPRFQSGMMFATALMIGVWLAVGHS